MTVYLTDTRGDSWTLRSVESVRLVALHVVEMKTFGNEPVQTRDIARFTVAYDSTTALDKA